MPQVLTDADIDRLSAKPLTDADIETHDSQPKGSAAGDFAKGAWSKLSPVQALRGMADSLERLYNDPKATAKDFAKEVLAHPYMAFSRGVEAAKAGKAEEAMAHFNNMLEPAGFMTEASEVKAATPGQRAEGFGEMAGLGVGALLGAKAPQIAGKVPEVLDKAKSLVVPTAKATASGVGNFPVFPRTVGSYVRPVKAAGRSFSAARDAQAAEEVAAIPTAREVVPPPIPADPTLDAIAQRLGAKDFASGGKALQELATQIRQGQEATQAARAAQSAQVAPVTTGDQVVTTEPVTTPVTPPPTAKVGGGGPLRPPLAKKAASEVIPPGPPPSAWLDNETTGLQIPRVMANRAAKAQRFIDKMGGTQNLPRNQAEWVKLADQIGENVPSAETQAQITFGLNKLMRAGKETPGKLPPAEVPAWVKNAKDPVKALKAAEKLREAIK